MKVAELTRRKTRLCRTSRVLMEFIFVHKNEATQKQQEMLKAIEEICFGVFPIEQMENSGEGHLFGAIEVGALLLMDDERLVGNTYLYKRATEYYGQEYFIGGLGGLAVMPEYRGRGYARQLIEKTLELAYEIGVDVACLFTEREDSVHELYEKMGFSFLSRRGYYIDSLQQEAFRDDIMIMGLNNKKLAKKILLTDFKFHYGEDEGCW